MLIAASVRIASARPGRLVEALGAAGAARATGEPTPIDRLTAAERERIQLARRVGRIVERGAGVLPWHPTCLRQSLATHWMLRRRRIASVIHLGIADVASMDAHAWVTVDERVVNGRRQRQFTAVASFHE